MIHSSDENAWLATGHYAHIVWSENGRPKLFRARDRKKDQTYFLSCVNENALARVGLSLIYVILMYFLIESLDRISSWWVSQE